MKDLMRRAATDIEDPQRLRRDIQETDIPEMRRRKAIVALNLAGLSMGLVSLQMGMVRRLPEPSMTAFGLPMKTKRVNFSDAAFGYGAPDAPSTSSLIPPISRWRRQGMRSARTRGPGFPSPWRSAAPRKRALPPTISSTRCPRSIAHGVPIAWSMP